MMENKTGWRHPRFSRCHPCPPPLFRDTLVWDYLAYINFAVVSRCKVNFSWRWNIMAKIFFTRSSKGECITGKIMFFKYELLTNRRRRKRRRQNICPSHLNSDIGRKQEKWIVLFPLWKTKRNSSLDKLHADHSFHLTRLLTKGNVHSVLFFPFKAETYLQLSVMLATFIIEGRIGLYEMLHLIYKPGTVSCNAVSQREIQQ